MGLRPPKYLRVHEQRGIAFTTKDEYVDYPWAMRLSYTEGIRWAHNAACRVVQKLVDFVPDEYKDFLIPHASNYSEILDCEVQQWFQEHNMVP
jgi:hypothetical protein